MSWFQKGAIVTEARKIDSTDATVCLDRYPQVHETFPPRSRLWIADQIRKPLGHKSGSENLRVAALCSEPARSIRNVIARLTKTPSCPPDHFPQAVSDWTSERVRSYAIARSSCQYGHR